MGSTDEVGAATERLAAEGLDTMVEEHTSCCYAVQDKVWVGDADGAPWEVYTVLADAPGRGGVRGRTVRRGRRRPGRHGHRLLLSR